MWAGIVAHAGGPLESHCGRVRGKGGGIKAGRSLDFAAKGGAVSRCLSWILDFSSQTLSVFSPLWVSEA